MLASRKMSPKFNVILNDVINITNHINDSRLFVQLCEEMDAEHKRLLLYIEVRLLSKGRSLARVFELRELVQRFLSDEKSPLATHFNDEEWVAKTCLPVRHIQPAQPNQSVTSGENDNCL
jgi:hypothetical protein